MEVVQSAKVKQKDYASVKEFTTAQREKFEGHCKYCIRTHSDYCN